ncbi:MAG: methyltransferase domain-containing protein [Candidatus Bathyarchaeota archaeon]|nr:methyltransferase domain-containing protein [Candidatus Bathyarchaeota archaeon]
MNKWNQKRKVMRRYDLTAEIYEMRYAEEQVAKYKAALDRLKITHDSRVIDVGCGSGLLFNHIAAQAQIVIGVDLSEKLLIHAKERARDFRNIHLIQADADHLPFKNNNFNVVFAFTLLQNMPKYMETLFEIKRIADRGASVVATGLKKAFSLEAFSASLHDAGLNVVSLEDADGLKCYVAVTIRN